MRTGGDYAGDPPDDGKRSLPDPARATRLREARRFAGFERPVDAVYAFGWNRSTYFGHENGSRGISLRRIKVYADAFRVTADWLAYGQGQMRPTRRTIRIEGRIGSLGMVDELGDIGLELEEIELPPGAEAGDFIALEVRGNDNFPAWENGDVVLVPRQHGPPEDYIGRRCLITLPDGSRLIRTVMRGSRNDAFILMNFSSPPMVDVPVIDVAPIAWTKHNRPRSP